MVIEKLYLLLAPSIDINVMQISLSKLFKQQLEKMFSWQNLALIPNSSSVRIWQFYVTNILVWKNVFIGQENITLGKKYYRL